MAVVKHFPKANLFKKLKIGRALLKSLREFLSTTSLHAYHYLIEPDRHISEFVMWVIFHIISTFVALYIVSTLKGFGGIFRL